MGGDVPGDDSTDNESAESFQNNGPDGEYQGDVHRDTRDPIEAAADETHDLYDIATWEPRSVLDRFAVGLHTALLSRGRTVLVVMALAIVIAEFALVAVSIADEPVVGLYVFLSVVPAFGIAAYVWRADVTKREPLGNLVVTFLFGFLFAGFAAIVNTVLQGYFQFIPWIGLILFFFLVVAPVEEFVKWLAIRLYAYPSRSFDSVIDGAVYGAIAGLGFATIENSLYIVQRYLETQQMGSPEAGVGAVIGIAALRTFAGPGHVLYAAFSGYYLGLAKFNPGDRVQSSSKGW